MINLYGFYKKIVANLVCTQFCKVWCIDHELDQILSFFSIFATFFTFLFFIKILWQQIIHPPMQLIQLMTHIERKLQPLQHTHGM